eukprot:6338511-Lingulodinium_polyedra.AAC.1
MLLAGLGQETDEAVAQKALDKNMWDQLAVDFSARSSDDMFGPQQFLNSLAVGSEAAASTTSGEGKESAAESAGTPSPAKKA